MRRFLFVLVQILDIHTVESVLHQELCSHTRRVDQCPGKRTVIPLLHSAAGTSGLQQKSPFAICQRGLSSSDTIPDLLCCLLFEDHVLKDLVDNTVIREFIRSHPELVDHDIHVEDSLR